MVVVVASDMLVIISREPVAAILASISWKTRGNLGDARRGFAVIWNHTLQLRLSNIRSLYLLTDTTIN